MNNYSKVMKIFVFLIIASLFLFSSCRKKSENANVITVGATAVPHADILENAVKKVLKEKGYELKTVVFNDYVLPNRALEDGELDANYYQTLGYMQDQNKNANLHLYAVIGVHIEPMGVYSSKYKAISEIKDGATIGIPNDYDNGLRALRLLAQKGLLKSLDDVDVKNVNFETIGLNENINPRKFKIVPLEAAALPRSLSDLSIAIINGNFALSSKLVETSPAIEIEEFDEKSARAKTNFVVVKSGNEKNEKINALVQAIQSEEVKKYIEEKYKGSVITSYIKL